MKPRWDVPAIYGDCCLAAAGADARRRKIGGIAASGGRLFGPKWMGRATVFGPFLRLVACEERCRRAKALPPGRAMRSRIIAALTRAGLMTCRTGMAQPPDGTARGRATASRACASRRRIRGRWEDGHLATS